MIFNLFASFILPLGYGVAVNSINDDVNHVEIVNEVQPKLVSYNDNSYEISFSAFELNNYSFSNLKTYVVSNNITSGISLVYNAVVFDYDETYNTAYISYMNEHNDYIVLGDYTGVNSDSSLFGYYPDNYVSRNNFSYDVILTLDSSVYDGIKSAIELDISANQSESMGSVLGDFVSIMVGGISSLATGIASGVVSIASALFLNVDASGNVTGLSIFGGIIAIFAGLALAIGLTTKVYTWVTSLGN